MLINPEVRIILENAGFQPVFKGNRNTGYIKGSRRIEMPDNRKKERFLLFYENEKFIGGLPLHSTDCTEETIKRIL